MILFVLAYLGGALTIVSPCILPVLPFLFARADRPFASSGLPLLAGGDVRRCGHACRGPRWLSGSGQRLRMVVLSIAFTHATFIWCLGQRPKTDRFDFVP
jgi:hypothetical protein